MFPVWQETARDNLLGVRWHRTSPTQTFSRCYWGSDAIAEQIPRDAPVALSTSAVTGRGFA